MCTPRISSLRPCNSTPHNANSRNSTPVHPHFALLFASLQSMERDDSLSADEQDDQSELREKLRIVKTVLEQAAFNGINRKVGGGRREGWFWSKRPSMASTARGGGATQGVVLEQAAYNGINRKVGEGGGEEQGGREEQSLVPEQRHAHICSGTKPCRHPP